MRAHSAKGMPAIRRHDSIVAETMGAVTWGLPLRTVFRLALEYISSMLHRSLLLLNCYFPKMSGRLSSLAHVTVFHYGNMFQTHSSQFSNMFSRMSIPNGRTSHCYNIGTFNR